jgi:hypothetical protein
MAWDLEYGTVIPDNLHQRDNCIAEKDHVPVEWLARKMPAGLTREMPPEGLSIPSGSRSKGEPVPDPVCLGLVLHTSGAFARASAMPLSVAAAGIPPGASFTTTTHTVIISSNAEGFVGLVLFPRVSLPPVALHFHYLAPHRHAGRFPGIRGKRLQRNSGFQLQSTGGIV